jgi:site-specific DNA recombinase
MSHYLIYVRRSYKRADAADVSDETQEQVARSLLPPGATVEVIRDSGGHNSGATGDREGYQRLIARVREGGIAGVAVYDLSRLARNVALMARLREELEKQQVAILAGNLPNTKHDSAVGRFMFNMVVSAAQFQRDLDSERMSAMMRRTFEEGGPRGNDPFGYRTMHDEAGKVVQPRTLEVVEHEAVVVRRVFALLVRQPFSEIAAILNREGARHREPRPWTHSAVKDLWRRREVYRGMVTSRRGLEVRPGRHPAILTDEQFRDALIGVNNRRHSTGPKLSPTGRTYLLRGLVYCECGARMRGATQTSRGVSHRYYACPISERRGARLDEHGDLVTCRARRIPAADAESAVLDSLTRFVVPPEEMEAAQRELRRRLAQPTEGGSDKERARLTRRLEQLRKQNEWGDLDDAEYRRLVNEVRAELTALPSDSGKVIEFSKYRRIAASLPDAIASATPEQVQELLPALVERVDVRDRQVADLTWTPPAQPFFVPVAPDEAALFWRPRTDSNRRRRP